MATRITLVVGPTRHEVEIAPGEAAGAFRATIGGDEHAVALTPIGDGTLYRLVVAGEVTEVAIKRAPGGFSIAVGADTHQVQIARPGAPGSGGDAAAAGEVPVYSPMTGTIAEILVAPGDTVERGDPLLVIVAMKMNNEIKAPAAGEVKSVAVEVNATVQQNGLLLVIDAGTGEDEA